MKKQKKNSTKNKKVNAERIGKDFAEWAVTLLGSSLE